MTKIGFILGTRPEIIKLYSCIKQCVDNNIEFFIINTDQHYDKNMRDVFFTELGLPTPEYMLGVGSGSHAKMLASMLGPIEDVLIKEKPEVVMVQGDTNTVLAGALVAVKLGIKVAHVEAGLRSYDKTMPEEYNRIITDHISDYLFPPTEKQKQILLQEGIPENVIEVTGNTVVDAALAISEEVIHHDYKPYILLTSHRPSNTDNDENLTAILSATQQICEENNLVCVFPVHPRLNSKISLIKSFDRIHTTEPLGYKDLISRIKGAEIIFTDSGGIQEESCVLRKKCIILRKNTERPETIEVGGAVILDEITENDIKDKYNTLIEKNVDWYNPFGDGKAGERIIATLTKET